MIEIQCPSCQTRYRIDEAVLPQDNPTFKCSRCGHVFSGDSRPSQPSGGAKPAPGSTVASTPRPEAQAAGQNSFVRPKSQGNQAAGAAPGRSERDNPLARSFAEDESKSFENLSFDFGDDGTDGHEMGESGQEPAAESDDPREHWQVGEPESEPEAAEPPPPRQAERPTPAPARPQRRSDLAAKPAAEAEPPEYLPRHTSGFFLFLFAIIVLSFAALTLLLGLAPPTSRRLLASIPGIGPTFHPHPTIADQVALVGVQGQYRQIGGQQTALVISGMALNRSPLPLHTIEIRVALLDSSQQELAANSVFCGDLVSPRMVGQMTGHELQFFQNLAPPKNFVLRSGQSAPFLAVVLSPPQGSSAFRLSVLKVQPASGAPVKPPAA